MDEMIFPGWEGLKDFPLTESEKKEAFDTVMARARRIEEGIRLREKGRRARRIRRIVLSVSAAAAWILPVLLWTTKSSVVQETEKQAVAETVKMVQCSTPRGEMAEVLLPDHSRVVLNAESVLIYPESFESGRRVFLSGEAVFDVTASEEYPFLVETADIGIRVHGTRFNVQAYFDDPRVTATLCRGEISAWTHEAPETVIELEPNYSFSYDRESHSVTTAKVNSLESVAWENGDLCFRSAQIRDVIRTLQRRFRVSIYLTSDKYDSELITARFIHGETLEDLLDALCAIIPGMRYLAEGDSVYLK